jgi:hypothetical protein
MNVNSSLTCGNVLLANVGKLRSARSDTNDDVGLDICHHYCLALYAVPSGIGIPRLENIFVVGAPVLCQIGLRL